MHQKVEINSFLATKLKDDISFTKYDIEASIDEVESEEDHVRLKYRFVLLSNPTNVKISIDGFTTVHGNQQEITRQLGNDERNIPRVVNTIYQEIFPFLYITSKTMFISCPAYKLADIAKTNEHGMRNSLGQTQENHTESHSVMNNTLSDNHPIEVSQNGTEAESTESIIQEQKIPSV